MGGWLKLGRRKIGIECCYLVGSAIFMYLSQTYVVRPTGWDSALFYFVFFYNVVTYISLVASDPGRIEETEYLKKLDLIVSVASFINVL
jgi:hypothetical protein